MINKREAIKQYKQTIQPMGIFHVQNLQNGKVFIGSSKNLQGKINSTRFQLQQGSHMNRELQKDFSAAGEQNFTFSVLDTLEPKEDLSYDYTEDLKVLEQIWMEKLQPYGEKGYHKKKD